MTRPRLDTRGAVTVEYLVAFLPVLLFFASVWQLADLYAAQLIVRRAASAAGRAASVVLPDDPHWYGGAPVNAYTGARRTQIELAANIILAASPRMLEGPEVSVTGASGNGPLTATVRATLLCYPGWSVFVCGVDGQQQLSASARYPYHGATYGYE